MKLILLYLVNFPRIYRENVLHNDRNFVWFAAHGVRGIVLKCFEVFHCSVHSIRSVLLNWHHWKVKWESPNSRAVAGCSTNSFVTACWKGAIRCISMEPHASSPLHRSLPVHLSPYPLSYSRLTSHHLRRHPLEISNPPILLCLPEGHRTSYGLVWTLGNHEHHENDRRIPHQPR